MTSHITHVVLSHGCHGRIIYDRTWPRPRTAVQIDRPNGDNRTFYTNWAPEQLLDKAHRWYLDTHPVEAAWWALTYSKSPK